MTDRTIRFSENITYLIDQGKLTQQDFATRMDVGQTTVSQWCTGTAYPRVEKLLEIVEFLNVGLDAIMYADLPSGPPNAKNLKAEIEDFIHRLKLIADSME